MKNWYKAERGNFRFPLILYKKERSGCSAFFEMEDTMKKRLLAAALACLLLTGCGAVRTEPLAEEPAAEGAPIAYVPLDDRPDNVERVVYLAESLGYRLAMPEEDDYRTRLNGQPLNENGTQSGDRADLYQWVMEQEAAGCDRYILSLDQMLSGGLVNSRAMFNHEDVHVESKYAGEPMTWSVSYQGETTWHTGTVPDTVWSEYELLGNLLTTLTADENNRVWLLDSVMRLAPTVGYQHWTLEEYNALRTYGAEPRPVLTGAALTLGNIEDTYRKSPSGGDIAYDVKDSQLAEYLAARSRKLELSDAVQEMLTALPADNVRLLIGIDDSSEEDSIQKNEIAYLRSRLRPGDALLSGVDDLAFKAVTKLYLDEIGWEGAATSIHYFGGTEDRPACAYDYKALTEIVVEHLAFFDLTEKDTSAEMNVLVLTQPADEGKQADYINTLIKELNSYQKGNVPVILIDASNGQYGTAFHEALTEKTELGRLLSYAGFLDMAIVTGTALSHGVARYAYLTQGAHSDAADRAFVRTLADSILKDFCYKNVVRDDILAYVRNDLNGSADNFWTPDIDREAILARLESGMETAMAPVIQNLERSNFVSALPSRQPYAERGWGGIAVENYRFPWDRAFEIGMDIQLGDFTEPHKQVLGVYYQ